MAHVTLRSVLNTEFAAKDGGARLRATADAYILLGLGLKGEYETTAERFTIAVMENPEYVSVMAATWCRIYLDHATGGLPLGGGAIVRNTTFQSVRTGETSDSAPYPALDWAGRLITTVIKGDPDGFKTTWEELPADDWADRVLAVLESVVLTMQNTPRGYAVRHLAGGQECSAPTK